MIRSFSSTAGLLLRSWHSLFPKIDWTRIESGQYAVVDPADPLGILYLSEKDYKIQVRVSLSQDLPLVVLARPGDKKPTISDSTTSSQTPPHSLAKPSPIPNISEALKGAEEVIEDDDRTIESVIPSSKEDESPPVAKESSGSSTTPSEITRPVEQIKSRTTKEKRNANPKSLDELRDPKTGKKVSELNSDELSEYLSRVSRLPDYFGKSYAQALQKAEVSRQKVSGGWSQFFSWYLSSMGDLVKPGSDQKGTVVSLSEKSLSLLIWRWGLILDYRLGGPLIPSRTLQSALKKLAKDLYRIQSTQGSQTLIMKMKNTMLFMNHYLSGKKPDNPWLLGTPVGLARSGLPRIIPLVIRRQIANGSLDTIRFMESLLSSYKVMEGTYEPQTLSSVMGEHPVIDSSELSTFKSFCSSVFWPKVVLPHLLKAGKQDLLKNPSLAISNDETPYVPLRAGPNESVGLLGAHLDAYAWSLAPNNYVRMWAEHIGDTRFVKSFDQTLQNTQKLFEHYPPKEELHLGRIALLYEPAGKVRSIAIVDYWTQRAMHPVHKWMMKILKHLPGDSTFNQDKSVKSFAELGSQTVWSVDLKSATDLIPLELYEILFGSIWPEETMNLWSLLLTDRWFLVPQEGVVEGLPHVCKYGRGQPMGTLSSWASMALLHHAIVHYSAWKSGVDPTFSEYRVLGDDVVIGHPGTALEYLSSTKGLSIPISLPKTLVGKLFIFASQIYLCGQSVSPSSLKEESNVRSFSQRLEMALRAVSRGWISDKPSISRFLRLLLPRRLYKASVKSWRVGKLGKAAQAALISAFGTGSHAMHAIGLQGSQIMTFLLALQDRAVSLVGDQSRLDPELISQVRDIEVSLAIVMVQRVRHIAIQRHDALIEAGVRWSEWVYAARQGDGLPTGTIPGPVKPILVYNETLRARLRSKALWPAIEDSYMLFFGTQADDALASVYTEYINDDEGWGEEDLGMGVTFTEEKHSHVTTDGYSTATPLLWQRAGEGVKRLEEIIETLKKGYEVNESLAPMDLVQEAVQLIADIPRVPDFLGPQCLAPDRSPKGVDAVRSFVRQVRDWDTVLRYFPLCSMNSKAIPLGDSSPELEAILALDPLSLPKLPDSKKQVLVPGQSE